PFAPGGPQIWTNQGVDGGAPGAGQSALVRPDAKWDARAHLQRDASGYELTLSLPHNLIFSAPAALPAAVPAATSPATHPAEPGRLVGRAVLNIAVHDNDETAKSFVRSWADERAGTSGWGQVELWDPRVAH